DVGAHHLRLVLNGELLQMLVEVGEELEVAFDKGGRRRTATDRLHADNTRAGEDVEEGPLWNGIAKDAEQRFADHLRRRSQIGTDTADQLAATQRSRHNADLSTHEHS